MTTFDFNEILETYETERDNIESYVIEKTNESELHTIKVDVDRSFTFLPDLDIIKREKLRVILHLVLTTIPVSYLQCMAEISSVIIYHYFKDDIDGDEHMTDAKIDKNEDAEESDSDETNIDDEKKVNSNQLLIDDDLLEKARITITNILIEKFDPLVNDEFSLYVKYNSVFREMMKKRGVIIQIDESLVFMNTTLTWFIRSCENFEDTKRLIGYMLACPLNFPFLLLVKFYDVIENKETIKYLENELYEQLLVLEKEFLETESEMKNKNWMKAFKMKDILLAGAVLVVGIAIIYNMVKKKDE